MKFEAMRGPADKPGGGGGDDERLTPEMLETFVERQHQEAAMELVRFFRDRHEIGESALPLDHAFTEEEYINAQQRFSDNDDRENGVTGPQPEAEEYAEAIQADLEMLVEAGYIEADADVYHLTVKGKSLIPRVN